MSVLLAADYQIERKLEICVCVRARVGQVRVCTSIWPTEFVGLPARLQLTVVLLVFVFLFH